MEPCAFVENSHGFEGPLTSRVYKSARRGTKAMNDRTPAPHETTQPRCGTCQRTIAPGASSVVFPMHHSKCVDRAVARARAHVGAWDEE